MLLLGLALATGLWSAVEAINGEARASYARAAAVLGQNQLDAIARPDGARFPQQSFVALRQAGWLVTPLIEGEVRFGTQRLRILGIDPLTMPPEASEVDLAGGGAGLAEFITPPGLLFVSPETAARLEGESTPPLRLTPNLPPGTALADIGIAQSLLKAEGELSRLLLWPEASEGRLPLNEAAPGLVRLAPREETDIARLTDSFHLNLTAFGFLSFAVGIFIVHAAVGLAFEQRRPVFRTLRALGLPLRALVALAAFELLVLASIAGIAGVLLGYWVAALLMPDVAASLRGLYGAEVSGALGLRPGVWVTGLLIAIGGTCLSAAAGLWRLWTMPVLAPARPRAWGLASETTVRVQAAGGVLCLVAAGALTVFGSGLVAGFMALGALLLGAALLLPLLLSSLLRLGSSLSRGPLAQWFWADTRQQLSGLSLALMALLLALATNAGVGTMVESFRLTFTGWLDQRLASELYVTTRNEDESRQVREWLVQRSDAVLPIWNTEARFSGQPIQIFGVVDHPTYRDNWPLLEAAPQVWDDVAAERAVLINEQLSRRLNLNVGSEITLPEGPRLPVAGIFSDYGNPKGQIILATDLLTRLYPETNRLRYAVRIAPGKVAALSNELRDRFGLPADHVIDQASVKSFSLRVFERTFAVTAALNVLTLGVAALAIFASLLTLSGMRLPQLAPVWAMGVTRRRLAALELARSLALAAMTMLLAVPLGLALAWMLLAVVNVEAFGWRLPLHIFPLDWARLALLALLAASLAALLPALAVMRLAPASLAKVFANER